jgi:hypothetical protein
MSRLVVLKRHSRRTVAGLSAVLAAVAVAVGSGADFTASSPNPSNTFSSGSLSISNSNDNAAILSAGGLKPGGTGATGTVDIKNAGSLSGVFTLSRGTPVDAGSASPLSGKLNVSVGDCGLWSGTTPPSCASPTTVYSGTLAQMGQVGHTIGSLGTFAGGDKHRYQFTVSLDSSADDGYQAGTTTVEFDWSATQS